MWIYNWNGKLLYPVLCIKVAYVFGACSDEFILELSFQIYILVKTNSVLACHHLITKVLQRDYRFTDLCHSRSIQTAVLKKSVHIAR